MKEERFAAVVQVAAEVVAEAPEVETAARLPAAVVVASDGIYILTTPAVSFIEISL